MVNVKEYLIDNNLEIININTHEIIVAYKFDLVELDAANAYARELTDISDEEREIELKDYLKDIASDNIDDIIDEISDELDVDLTYEVAEQVDGKQLFSINKNVSF